VNHGNRHRRFERPRGFVSFEAECQEAQKVMGVFPLGACACGHCWRLRLPRSVEGRFQAAQALLDAGLITNIDVDGYFE